ncbi:MAG: gamma-glutamyl-gamma-aminobutyrate hydrolase family protein [Oscillospiraceae bacterium]|nr:gamma-glutamyl-gamma-aminobutyrate hydrolase family protein [Oscillospiraceae bacterium]
MIKVFLGWTSLPFKNYIEALTMLGAEVEREDIESCGALLLPGGEDIHPRFYAREVSGAIKMDEARDEFELSAFRRFMERGRPILGICRGEQLINVALGGTLIQNMDGHGKLPDDSDSTHGVRTDDVELISLFGGRFTVNSAHHQAIERLGEGLRAVAWAEDGTVEAIRHVSAPVFGVQWHPERLREKTGGWELIRRFLENAKNS